LTTAVHPLGLLAGIIVVNMTRRQELEPAATFHQGGSNNSPIDKATIC
jgi:hypothetical protein